MMEEVIIRYIDFTELAFLKRIQGVDSLSLSFRFGLVQLDSKKLYKIDPPSQYKASAKTSRVAGMLYRDFLSCQLSYINERDSGVTCTSMRLRRMRTGDKRTRTTMLSMARFI